jgi:hypothetical protein
MQALGSVVARLGASFAGAVGSGESAVWLTRLLRSGSELATFAVLLVVAAILWCPLAARTGASRRLTGGLLLAFVAICGITLVPVDGWQSLRGASWSLSRIGTELGRPVPGLLTSWAHGSDGPLNVLLFIPAGFLCAMVFRRHVAGSVLALSATSLAIECTQAFSGLRDGSLADVVANSVGALCGASIAVAVTVPERVRRIRQLVAGSAPEHQH